MATKSLNDAAYAFYLREGAPTAFELGQSFRSFKLLSIPGTSTYTVKIVLPKPVYFTRFDIAIDSGIVQVETIIGGVSGGTFSETLPVIKLNLATPTIYTPTTVLTAGGTLTGGTVIDIVRQKTDSNATRATSVIQDDRQVRGIAAGTYYWRFNNLSNDVLNGTVKVEWEEL